MPHDGRITLGSICRILLEIFFLYVLVSHNCEPSTLYDIRVLGYSHIGRLPSDVLKNWKLIEFQKKLNQGGETAASRGSSFYRLLLAGVGLADHNNNIFFPIS